MSIPTGAKVLASITPSTVYYLIGENQSSSTFSTSYFTSKNAKPLNNYVINNVDPNLIRTIETSLPERSNNSPTVFDSFPNILDGNNDIVVDSTETTLTVSFISEGAGYLNSLGYYFYYVDTNGDHIILTNADDNLDFSNGYYMPTIVFPNASFSRSGGDLQSGGTRILKGNLSNGKFQNINIGFFLISNGWKTTGNGYLSTGTGYVMHTTPSLNANYDLDNMTIEMNNAISNANNQEEIDTITSTYKSDYRRGIQSIILFYITEVSWILTFEDILRPSGDSDYNDLVLLVKKDPAPSQQEINNYVTVTPPANNDVKGQVDSEGMFLWLDANYMCGSGINLILERTVHFRTTDITYTENGSTITISPKDYVLSLINNLNWNYNHEIIGQTSNSITQKFTFNTNDVNVNTLNGKVKLYILSTKYNVEDITFVTTYQTNYEILLDYQSIYVDLWYSTAGNSKYIDHEDFVFYCDTTPNNDLTQNNTNFEKTTVTLLAWGDPYVQQLDGSTYKLQDVAGKYVLLQNENISIIATTNTSPHTEQIQTLKGTTFFTNFDIRIKESFFKIDLLSMNFESEGKVKYSTTFDKNILKHINDSLLIKYIEEETNISYLTVVIDNLKIYFMKLPTAITVQNIVIFDMVSINLYALPNSTGGMISKSMLSMIE